MTRIGVYGGTFDPIHNGHLRVAKDIVASFALDRLLLIPAKRPPHKESWVITDTHHRYTMIALATESSPALFASLIEIDRPEAPYSVQTVACLLDHYKLAATELYFVLGADSFAELPEWHEPRRLIESCHMVVTSRPGYPINLAQVPAEWRNRIVDLRGLKPGETLPVGDDETTRIFLTDLTWIDVSATGIRESVRAGRSFRDYVPPSVANYIEKYGLYRTLND